MPIMVSRVVPDGAVSNSNIEVRIHSLTNPD